MALGPDDLIGQFILCRLPGNIPATWRRRNIGPWHLGYHPTLPVQEIIAADSTVIGWLLGYPISAQARLITEDVHFDVSPGASDAPEQFESLLYTQGGRFAAVFLGREASRVYLDPCGSLAAVFCPKQQIIASTASLIPYLNNDDDNHELIRVIEIPHEDTCYPFGLTPRRSVERLLPSHYLDLESWQAVRHWPKKEIDMVQDVPQAVLELASILKNNIYALAREYPVYLALTAGRDSRMLLACSREYLDKIAFFTVTVPNAGGRLDCQITPKMAKKFGLNHVIIPFVYASASQANGFLYRTGSCVHGLYSQIDLAYRRLGPQRPVLLGAAGELGRGFHWRKGDTETSRITADDLLLKSQMPNTPQIHQRAQRWLAGLPLKSALTIWGLLYNELFNGCWFGPLLYGWVSNAFCLFPFCHQRLIEIMLSLPAEYRRSNSLPIDLVKNLWPELLSLPFNWFVGLQRWRYSATWRLAQFREKLYTILKRNTRSW